MKRLENVLPPMFPMLKVSEPYVNALAVDVIDKRRVFLAIPQRVNKLRYPYVFFCSSRILVLMSANRTFKSTGFGILFVFAMFLNILCASDVRPTLLKSQRGDSGTNFPPKNTAIKGRAQTRDKTNQSPDSQPIRHRTQVPNVL